MVFYMFMYKQTDIDADMDMCMYMPIFPSSVHWEDLETITK